MSAFRRTSVWILALSLLSAATIAGCRGTFEDRAVGPPPGIEGYVVKKQDDRMLVVAADRSAIWFSSAPRKAKVGQRVQVWYGESQESYPARAKADRATIVLSPKPSGADLSEADAVREALRAYESAAVPVVRQAEYDAALDQWSVTIGVEDAEKVERVKDAPE
ncbi:DUF3221 domain-containing protein [Paenibacillus antri]|uniref:DUF3221 domain-containing protein n=1 Tax=Paenibacillus antri TaxID=2582848 RepID=A0A5R9G980_9BACL|nr:DUF3221 domain-containing protein [Paenibacillus antri]TLS49624.1 DUF3221 domain-containing protein [Paenibacillus antri]